MKTLLLISFLFLVTINAIIDASRIKKGKVINHTLEYIIFLVACIGVTIGIELLFLFPLTILSIGIPAFLGSTITRAGFFGFLLNKFRGLPLDYQSTSTTSETDIIEHEIEDIMKVQADMNIQIKDWMISMVFIIIYIILFFIKI